MSAPGAGKTALLERVVADLPGVRVGVLEGDVQGSMDADRLASLHVPVTQLNTDPSFGGECHLDANMVRSALGDLALDDIDLLVIENVGNLVCPAEFKVGEDARIMVSAITEGEEKPAKYPLMFRACELVLINKIDLLPHLDFDLDKFVLPPRRGPPGRGAHRGQRQDRRGDRRVAGLAHAGRRARGGARVTHALGADVLDRALAERTRANSAFFEAESERLARLCHRMAERFARGGRLIAFGQSPAARSDARHVAVEFVHPVIVGKRALPALGLAGEGGPLAAQVELVAEADDIAIGFGAGEDGEAAAALAVARGARLPDARLRPGRRRVGVRATQLGPLGPPGAGGDALPRALGAGARVLRPPRPARGPRGAPGARHRGVELPLSLPRASASTTWRPWWRTCGARCWRRRRRSGSCARRP